MIHEHRRRAGHVDVVLKEDRGIDDIEKLYVCAVFAKKYIERETFFILIEVGCRDKRVGRGSGCER
jgi:hypothetical protein